MRTHGQTMSGNEMDMAKAMAWAKRICSRERMALVIARLVLAGYAGIVLAQIFQTY